MTAHILQTTGKEAYELIYQAHLSALSEANQEVMKRTMANSSEVWLGMDDDNILCTWGLIAPTILSDRAYLWLYTTEHMTDHVFMFVRHSQRAVQHMLKLYPLIVGHCAVGQDKSIRWLRWLGAVFDHPDGKLIPFEIRAKVWPQEQLAL